MKIDLHVHTKKTKSGDAITRNVDAEKFHETLTSTDVKIVAITNHNDFDLNQYKEFSEKVEDEVQIWPGIELDVNDNEQRGHLIVIVSPTKSEEFGKIVSEIVADTTPDTFLISIEDVITGFDSLNPVYITHYQQKKPDLSDESIQKIFDNTQIKNRVLKEVTNAISAGIYISHGHRSIYGSDLQNWDDYEQNAEQLPELRLPVESFEQFCLLLEKDESTINTILNEKTTETISIKPFEDDTVLQFTFYNDINIFFGSKGTGKTKILEAIAKHYADNGIEANVFESSSEILEETYDLKGNDFVINLNEHGIGYCTNEIEDLKNSREKDVTKLSSYRDHYSIKLTNKKAQKIKIKDFTPLNTQSNERNFSSSDRVLTKITDFIDFVTEDDFFKELVAPKTYDNFLEILAIVSKEIYTKKHDYFFDSKVDNLFNNLIETIKNEIAKKTNSPPKPTSTGFQEYALNRISIERATKIIHENIISKIKIIPETVGDLGRKGILVCDTDVVIQDGTVIEGDYKSVSGVNKTPQKEFSRSILNILDNILTDRLFEEIANLNSIEYIEEIKTIHELLLIKKCFKIDRNNYKPSNGESTMLLLHNELNQEKDIYILDEPEKSLGNDYISDVIVPMIKDKARVGKKIFISTHDANIAVRTLPYNSIFRKHDINDYSTFVGNPFSNKLININDENDSIDWKLTSMKTLEGGEEAFGERGKIYGNT